MCFIIKFISINIVVFVLEDLVKRLSQDIDQISLIEPPSHLYIPSLDTTLYMTQRVYRGVYTELVLNSIKVGNKRMGIGTKIMEYLIETARNLGYSSIILNKAESVDFFKKFGFEEDDRDVLDYKLVL